MTDFRSAWALVRVCVYLTLAVTALRLFGALGGLPDFLVNREVGGTGAIIGISCWRRSSRSGSGAATPPPGSGASWPRCGRTSSMRSAPGSR